MKKQSNVLKEKDSKLFFSSYLKLLNHVNNKYHVVPLNPQENEKYLKHLCDIRDFIFEKNREKIIDDFLNHFQGELSKEEKTLVQDWKKYGILGKFFILKHYKTYSVFMDYTDPRKLYKAIGITDSMEKICPSENLPTTVSTALLPFNNEIIFDGLVRFDNVFFGSNITGDLNEDYQINKAKYGLISDLHHPIDFSNPDIEKLLKKYLKKPDYYEFEIEELIEESVENYILYAKLISENYVKKYKKDLKELSIREKYYIALYFDHIVQTGKTKSELEEELQRILPKEKLKYISIYKV